MEPTANWPPFLDWQCIALICAAYGSATPAWFGWNMQFATMQLLLKVRQVLREHALHEDVIQLIESAPDALA
jgi:hypothetical protein